MMEQKENQKASPGAPGKNPEGGGAALGTAGSIEEIAAPGRRHYPALDGLRGLAILLVLVCHYSLVLPQSNAVLSAITDVFMKGWVGVNLFFVLSGFLITGILYDAKGQSHYFRNFYARRTLRIFPLYYGFLALLLLGVLAYKFGAPAKFAHSVIGRALLSYQPWLWTYTFNIYCAVHNTMAVLVTQFWTLSVEEQFYLVWPLVVFACGRKTLMRICALLMAAALALRLVLTALHAPVIPIYVLTLCQMDSLAAGAFVALLVRGGGGIRATLASARPVVMISGGLVLLAVVGALLFNLQWKSSTGFPIGAHASGVDEFAIHPLFSAPFVAAAFYSVLAVFFAGVLALAIRSSEGLFVQFLKTGPMRSLGGYSYGIYVFHLPILVASWTLMGKFSWCHAFQASIPCVLLFIAANLAVTLAISFASFHLYEKRFLKLKKNFPEQAGPTAGAATR
jgi:peptidoglycan/LPS O-acetylase OafA/YrhL